MATATELAIKEAKQNAEQAMIHRIQKELGKAASLEDLGKRIEEILDEVSVQR